MTLPDVVLDVHAEPGALLASITARLAGRDLLGPAGTRDFAAVLESQLAAMAHNATFDAMSSMDGHIAATLPVPGSRTEAVRIRVRTVLSDLQVNGDTLEREAGEVDRMQHTFTVSEERGRILNPGGGDLSGSWTPYDLGGGGTAQVSRSESFGQPTGKRDESSQYQLGPMRQIGLRVDYHVVFERIEQEPSGAVRVLRTVQRLFAASGRVDMKVYAHDLARMQEQLSRSGRTLADWRFGLASPSQPHPPAIGEMLARRDLAAPRLNLAQLFDRASQLGRYRPERSHQILATILRGQLTAGEPLRLLVDQPWPADRPDPLTQCLLLATELGTDVLVDVAGPGAAVTSFRALPGGHLVPMYPDGGFVAARAALPPDVIAAANAARLDLAALFRRAVDRRTPFVTAVRAALTEGDAP